MKSNSELIQLFISGHTAGQSEDLTIDNNFLRGKDTIYSQRVNNHNQKFFFVINATEYTEAHTAIQNEVLTSVPEDGILRVVTEIPLNVNWLI